MSQNQKYMVTFNDPKTPPEKVEAAVDKAKEQGAVNVEVFGLVKSFSYEQPPDRVSIMESNDEIHVESDQLVHTQGTSQ